MDAHAGEVPFQKLHLLGSVDPDEGARVPSDIPLATVAQLVEHLVVVQDVAGSSPVGRP